MGKQLATHRIANDMMVFAAVAEFGYQNMAPLKLRAFLDFVKANLVLPAP